jgi:hypothetical protein
MNTLRNGGGKASFHVGYRELPSQQRERSLIIIFGSERRICAKQLQVNQGLLTQRADSFRACSAGWDLPETRVNFPARTVAGQPQGEQKVAGTCEMGPGCRREFLLAWAG